MLSTYFCVAQKPKKWRMQFMSKNWLCINEEVAYEFAID
jgi:hypothetical protein